MSIRSLDTNLHSFESLYGRYLEAIEWLSGQVSVSPQCRLNKYIPHLRKLSVNKGSSARVAILRDPDARSAFFEANEIIDALGPFATQNALARIPPDMLKKLPKGVTNYPDINNNDPSRETFFELFVASRLMQNNVPIDLGKGRCDVHGRMYGYNTFIECKRLSSDSKFVERTKEGIAQLDKRYSDDPKEAGIVFLAIDQVINPKLETIKLRDPFHHTLYLQQAFKKYSGIEYLGKITSELRKLPQEKTMAYLIRLSFPYVLTSISTPGFNSSYYFSSFFTTKSQHFRFFEKIEKKWLRKSFPN